MNSGGETGKFGKMSGSFPAMLYLLLPALLFGIVSLIQSVKSGGSSFWPVPQWNDEADYYKMVKTWLSVGTSKGYWGFEGGHAILGTGGAWSPAILFPYVVWGAVFGWEYGSVAVANAAFFCVANGVLLLILKPEKRDIIRLILLECLAGHILLYLNTIMSELLRYALAMVLAAMLYRLLFEEEDKRDGIFRYVIVPLYMIIITQMYIFFAFAIPIYVFAILKKKKWYWRTMIAFLSMAVVAGGSYYLLHLISSNYNIYKTEILLEALRKKELIGAIKTFLWMFKTGLIDLWNCFLSYTGYGMFRWFIPFLAILAVFPFLLLGVQGILYMKNKAALPAGFWNHDRQIFLVAGYSVSLFAFMYITVYSLEAFTFYRGAGIVVLFSLVFLSRLEKKRWFYIILAVYAMGLLYIPKNMADFNVERYITAEEKEEWNTLTEKLEEAMPLCRNVNTQTNPEENSKEALRWTNTAVLYSMEPKLICAMPAGIGVNFAMYSDEIITEAGYLVFSLETPENLRPDWLEQSYEEIYKKHGSLIEQNYYVQYSDKDYIIYRKRSDDLLYD